MAITKELVAKAGTYTNKQGEEKTRYLKVGVKMETEKGTMYKIEAMPVSFDGWVYERDLPEKTAVVKPVAEINEDVPF
jgi:hypothetical protein